MERILQVFECIRQAKLKFKPEKCQLLQKEVTVLGHLINEVRGFLGYGNYYRKDQI